MTRLPAVRPKDVIRALERAGFVVVRTSRGSHHQLRHPEYGTRVTVALHRKEMKRATLAAIIKSAGLTSEEFIDLL